MNARPRSLLRLRLLAAVALAGCGGGAHPSYVAPAPGDDAGAPDAAAEVDPDVALGGVISRTEPSLWEYETEIAVAPNGRDAFTIWMIESLGYRYDLGYAISHDGGASWSAPKRVPARASASVNACVAADASGDFHAIWLETAPRRRVMTATWLPAGDSFSIAAELSDPGAADAFDKPWLVTLADGTLFAAWGSDSGSTLWTARSVDRGASWSSGTFAPDGTLRNVVFPCTSGGRVHLAHLVPGGVMMTTSDDGGATFGAPVRVDVPGDAAFEPPSCVARGDDVWVAYGVGGGVGSTWQMALLDAVWVAHSTDGGRSFATHVRASAPTLGRHALLPRLGATDAGRLALAWYAGDAAGGPGRFVVAFSDRGDDWSARVTIEKPLALQPTRGGYDSLGDYVGLRGTATGVLVAFADNAPVAGASMSHVRVARVTPP